MRSDFDIAPSRDGEFMQTNERKASSENSPEISGEAGPEACRDQQLAAANAKLEEAQDAFLRAKAETENVRRSAQSEVERAYKYSIDRFAEALLPVKDSLETALKVDAPSSDSLKQGVAMTLKQLSSAFEKNQLSEIDPAPGEKPDPGKHEVIAVVPAEQSVNTIVDVPQKGYMIADRLLRPALVTVAREPERPDSG